MIKVSGHRLGTAEVQPALVSHPAVAEAAAIGLPEGDLSTLEDQRFESPSPPVYPPVS